MMVNDIADGRQEAIACLIGRLRDYAEISGRVVDLAGAQRGHFRTDLRTLSILMRRQANGLETTPKDLRRLLGLSSASTTALVDRLVEHGHAKRSRSRDDRRSVQITHTESAAREGRKVLAPIIAHISSSLDDFTEEELLAASRVLANVIQSLLDAEEEIRESGPSI